MNFSSLSPASTPAVRIRTYRGQLCHASEDHCSSTQHRNMLLVSLRVLDMTPQGGLGTGHDSVLLLSHFWHQRHSDIIVILTSAMGVHRRYMGRTGGDNVVLYVVGVMVMHAYGETT